MTTTYQLPMFDRLEARTPWNGGMLAGSDVLTLADAARFASKHAGTEITPADFFRAAARGQIPMRAICRRTVTLAPCRETDEPLPMPENTTPTLPLDACKALNNTGRASWRTVDGYEKIEAFEGLVLGRFPRWQLPENEPDLVTTSDDCRLMGWDVHALADSYLDSPDEAQQPAPATEGSASEPAGPLPLATGDIAFCFAGLRWTEQEWRKPLGDKPKWLEACIAVPGRRGVSETRWYPVCIAAALVRNGHANARSVRAAFQRQPLLMPWLEAWKTYEADYIDSE